jgi:hypothetical protein
MIATSPGCISFEYEGRLADLRCRWWAAHARRTGEAIGPTGVADDWINDPEDLRVEQREDLVHHRQDESERDHPPVRTEVGEQQVHGSKILTSAAIPMPRGRGAAGD